MSVSQKAKFQHQIGGRESFCRDFRKHVTIHTLNGDKTYLNFLFVNLIKPQTRH
jgi:hypothetical protein